MYENIETILVLMGIVAIIAAFLAWREIKYAAKNMADYDARVKAWGKEQEKKAADDERDRRRMVREADSKPVSMEPFCSEGKKKRERKQESRATGAL